MVAVDERPTRCPTPPQEDSEGVRWLAMLLRQACLLIASAVEQRYGLQRRGRER